MSPRREEYRPFVLLFFDRDLPEKPRYAQTTWRTRSRAVSGALAAAAFYVRKHGERVHRIHAGVEHRGRTVWVQSIVIPRAPSPERAP